MLFVLLWDCGHLLLWGRWSCVLRRYTRNTASWVLPECVAITEGLLVFVPCYSDTAKIKERTFRSGIRFEKRDEQGSKLHLRPRKKGNLWKNMPAYLLTAFGSASERDEEFSSALTWVRNVCQQHARAQRTRHLVQTIISLNIKEPMAFWVNLEEEKGNREALSLCVDGIKIKRNPMKHNASLYLLTPRVFNCPPCPEAEELGRNWGVFLHLGK